MKAKSHVFLSAATGTGASDSIQPNNRNKVFHLTGFVSASTGAASVTVEGSNDGVNWFVLDTLTLTLGTAITSDSGVNSDAWLNVRGNVGSISGTNAQVTLTMSTQE